MSEGLIYKLIPKVMADIGAIGKDRKNEQQHYKFRGIEDFYNAAHPALVKHGVFCCPQVLECESTDRVRKSGSVAIRVTMRVSHKFYAPDGSFVDVITAGEGIDDSDKASNKAMSAAMKYALIELFSVPTADVEDGDKTSPEVGIRPNGKVERTTEDTPLESILPEESALITVEQAKKLHMRFKDELREELKPHAEKLLHDFLGVKLYLDVAGNPSTKAIPKEFYAAIGKEAVAFARGL